MAEDDSFDARLAREVTLLSTKLVTAVAKQSELEETVLQLHKENFNLKTTIKELRPIQALYQELVPKYNELFKNSDVLKKDREKFEIENKKLQSEVEELSESLFNEANQMVSDASRETHNFKVKNKKLYEEIDEKNAIIENLQDQLKDLKNLFIKIEDQQKLSGNSRSNTPKLEVVNLGTGSDDKKTSSVDDIDSLSINDKETNPEINLYHKQLQSLIFTPSVKSIRFDINNYQHDFKTFIYHLIKPEFVFDLTNLKTLRYFKKIWAEELENSINVPLLPASNFINRWQKGKNFWNLLIEGKAMIQPVSGVNETFKLAYKGTNRDIKLAPIAIKDPCAFCGEHKDDVLEHARLYTLKLFSDSSIATDDHEVIAEYPLCNFCLIKLRNICEFFAKLRLINANVYKLKPNPQYDEVPININNFQFKRNGTSGSLSGASGDRSSTSTRLGSPQMANGEFKPAVVDKHDESIIMKLYVLLLLIRNKIFWSKNGFWDHSDDVEELNIDEIHADAFKIILEEEIMVKRRSKGAITPVTSPSTPNPNQVSSTPNQLASTPNQAPNHNQLASPSDLTGTMEEKNDSDEFADAVDTEIEPAPPKPLSRKNSKTKQFKAKMNNDLDETLQMLKESIEQ